MLIPGETAVHYFTMPFELSDVSEIIVTYKQRGYIVLEKVITASSQDVTFSVDDNKTVFYFRLTQEESLLFEDEEDYSVQLNVKMQNTNRVASYPVFARTGPQYKRQVI